MWGKGKHATLGEIEWENDQEIVASSFKAFKRHPSTIRVEDISIKGRAVRVSALLCLNLPTLLTESVLSPKNEILIEKLNFADIPLLVCTKRV